MTHLKFANDGLIMVFGFVSAQLFVIHLGQQFYLLESDVLQLRQMVLPLLVQLL